MTMTMMDDRAIVGQILQRPIERPMKGSVRATVVGLAITVILASMQLIAGSFQFEHIPGYVAAGTGISFFEWGADRLWYSTIGLMLDRPLSWYAYLTRIPFWYIAGGIGYELAVLIVMRYRIIETQDILARAVFSFGGQVGTAVQLVLQTHLYISFIRPLAKSGMHHSLQEGS